MAARQAHEALRQEAEVLAGPAPEADSDDDRPPLATGGRFWDVFVETEWRLEMLETHAPGVLSEALREALLEDGVSTVASAEDAAKQRPSGGQSLDAEEAGSFIWKGIVRWGYPPGWIASEGLSPHSLFRSALAGTPLTRWLSPRSSL